jgi:hypothetical protein
MFATMVEEGFRLTEMGMPPIEAAGVSSDRWREMNMGNL